MYSELFLQQGEKLICQKRDLTSSSRNLFSLLQHRLPQLSSKILTKRIKLNQVLYTHNQMRKPQFTSFNVNVPVLSLQMVVAEPIVSQAESLRTCNVSHVELLSVFWVLDMVFVFLNVHLFLLLSLVLCMHMHCKFILKTKTYQSLVNHHFSHGVS